MNEDVLVHDCSVDGAEPTELGEYLLRRGTCLYCGTVGEMQYIFASGALCNDECDEAFRLHLERGE